MHTEAARVSRGPRYSPEHLARGWGRGGKGKDGVEGRRGEGHPSSVEQDLPHAETVLP